MDQVVLLAVRPVGADRPVHAVEALTAPGEETIVDDRTVCNRLSSAETDLVRPELRWLAVPVADRCASCSYFANARDAGLPLSVPRFDGAPRWHRDGDPDLD